MFDLSNRNRGPRGLAVAVAVAALTAAASVSAQQATTPAAPATDTEPVQEITVTGSRIAVPANINATSPIQVVTAQDFQQQGITDTITMINRLPQNIIASASDFGNNTNPLTAAGGIATADLRGLGPQRTLVLVDGRRLGPGDPNTANPNVASDLDQIPAPLIERVDVVTGGASATYGSDAIAGVVNFIMKKNFDGVEVGGNYGFAQHNNTETWAQQAEEANGFAAPTGSLTDAENRDLYILMGHNFGDNNANVTGFFTYHNQAPVNGTGRDFADCEILSDVDVGGPPTKNICLGSSTSNKFTINGSPYSVVGSSFLPYPQTGSTPPPIFNSAAYEFLQRQDERYSAGLNANLYVNDYIKPYLQFSYMNDKTQEIVGPSALFQSSNPFTANNQYLVNCSNPLLSAQEQSILCTPAQITADTASPGSASGNVNIGRRNIEGGGRLSYYEHNNFRVVAGSTGTFASDWKYDAYAQFAYTTLFNDNENYLNYGAVTSALQATTGPGGTPVCVSGAPCVPYDIFKQGGVTQAQLAYLYTPGTAYGQNWEEVQHVDISGELGDYHLQSPWSKDGLAVNFGAEHRFEALNFAPDGAELAGDLAGFSGASVAIDKGYDVWESFAEFRAPILQDLPFAKDLTIDGGYRWSDYSTAGRTNTFKMELQYAPTEDIRLRASFNRAVRAPNLIELYNPQSYGQQSFVGVDPCAPTVGAGGVITGATTASAAQCAHTGVSTAQYGNGNVAGAVYNGTLTQCISDQCGQVIGGNTNLKPEVGLTSSVGFTFTPTFLPGFSGSIDYYHIKLEDVITSAPGAYAFNQCLDSGTAADCALIVRNGVTGSLTGATVAGGGYILQTDQNIATEVVSGFDLQSDYRWPIGDFGTLVASLSGSFLQHTTTEPAAGAPSFDCAGLYGATCSFAVNPTWRHNLKLGWITPWDGLSLTAYWRFIGSVKVDNNATQPALHDVEVGAYDPVNAHIGSVSYLDLSAIWPVTKNVELSLTINNVMDKDPPIIAEDYNNGSTPSSYPTYDYLGRIYEFGVKIHL